MNQRQRKFEAHQLIEWRVFDIRDSAGYVDPRLSDYIADQHVCVDANEEYRQRVFRAPDDGKVYAVRYYVSHDGPWSEMEEGVEARFWYWGVEVEQVIRLEWDWEPKGDAPRPSLDLQFRGIRNEFETYMDGGWLER